MSYEHGRSNLGSLTIPSKSQLLLSAVVLTYVAVGILYAIVTPPWQAPDEPAHYNYIRSLAEGRGFPILELGDYDQEYLSRLTSEGFPGYLSINSLEYEDHQPPLYYVLATPIYLAFGGALVPLRLFSVSLGVVLLVLAFGAVRSVFPDRPWLASVAAGLIAFIPQHVAMTAAVNNDVLSELLVAGTIWASVAYLGKGLTRTWRLGILVGIALLTKTTAYIVVGVAIGAVGLRWRRERASVSWVLDQLLRIFVPALLIAAPWLIRNGMTYGWTDPLGLIQHQSVVESQPRSSEWLAQYGLIGLLRRLVRTTFRSFWGQFGWMALPLPASIYRILLLVSLLLAGGFATWLVRTGTSQSDRSSIGRRLSLLALSALLTLLAFLWYNLTFVQHQGRYLFPALIPLTTAAALGLRTLTKPLPKGLCRWSQVFFLGSLATLDLYCLWWVIHPNL